MNRRSLTNQLNLLGLLGLLLATALFSLVATAAPKRANKYRSIEVMRFEVKEGVEFPADYLVTMMEELATQLRETKHFDQVLRQGEVPQNATAVRLTGVVTEYKPGNRAMRYMVGFGAGKTKVTAVVRFIDRSSGAVVLEKKVDGKVILGGLIKGDSIGATRGLAKEVAKLAKERL